jgi:hypothetical protein
MPERHPTLAYSDNEQAAHAVYRYIKALTPPIRTFRLRPENYRRPTFSAWWLLPGAALPVQAMSKLLIDRVAEAPSLMKVGCQVARGLGRQCADLVPSSLVMGPSWTWHRWLNDVMGGVLDAPMRSIMKRADQDLFIAVSLYDFHHAEAGLQTPDDRAVFTVRDASLSLEPVVRPHDDLFMVEYARRMQDLVMAIEGIEHVWWYWIDLRIGVRVAYGKEPDDAGEDAWTATELWHHALEPWLPWIH